VICHNCKSNDIAQIQGQYYCINCGQQIDPSKAIMETDAPRNPSDTVSAADPTVDKALKGLLAKTASEPAAPKKEVEVKPEAEPEPVAVKTTPAEVASSISPAIINHKKRAPLTQAAEVAPVEPPKSKELVIEASKPAPAIKIDKPAPKVPPINETPKPSRPAPAPEKATIKAPVETTIVEDKQPAPKRSKKKAKKLSFFSVLLANLVIVLPLAALANQKTLTFAWPSSINHIHLLMAVGILVGFEILRTHATTLISPKKGSTTHKRLGSLLALNLITSMVFLAGIVKVTLGLQWLYASNQPVSFALVAVLLIISLVTLYVALGIYFLRRFAQATTIATSLRTAVVSSWKLFHQNLALLTVRLICWAIIFAALCLPIGTYIWAATKTSLLPTSQLQNLLAIGALAVLTISASQYASAKYWSRVYQKLTQE
jgi:hypothetical protein